MAGKKWKETGKSDTMISTLIPMSAWNSAYKNQWTHRTVYCAGIAALEKRQTLSSDEYQADNRIETAKLQHSIDTMQKFILKQSNEIDELKAQIGGKSNGK